MKKIKKSKKVVSSDDDNDYKYKAIRKDLDSLDITGTYNQLQKELKTDTRKMGRGQLLEAIDDASNFRWTAGKLLITAKKEKHKAQARHKRKLGKLEIKARKELSALKKKKSGGIDGQISQSLVENYLAANFKEFRISEAKLKEAQRNEKMLEILYKTWEGRTSLLQTQARLIGNVQVVPDQVLETQK